MKTTKTILMTVGTVLVATVAQANTITATLLGANGDSLSLTTTVTDGTGAYTDEYEYYYSLNTGANQINIVDVDGLGGGFNPFNTDGIGGVGSSNPHFSETASDIQFWGNAEWDSDSLQSGALNFWFYSPYYPISGTATAEDGAQYLTPPAGSANTLVPGTVPWHDDVVPDGGVTVALLGFVLVGIEGLRRKQSK